MSLFCYAVFCVLSSFPIILLGNRELGVLLLLSSRSYYCYCYLPLPHGAVGLSVV